MRKRRLRIRREYRDNLPPTSEPFVYVLEEWVGWRRFGFWHGHSEHPSQARAEWWLDNLSRAVDQRFENKVVKEVEING